MGSRLRIPRLTLTIPRNSRKRESPNCADAPAYSAIPIGPLRFSTDTSRSNIFQSMRRVSQEISPVFPIPMAKADQGPWRSVT